MSSLYLYYYLVVLLLFLNDLYCKISIRIQVGVDLYLTILGVALVDLGILPTHSFVEFSR